MNILKDFFKKNNSNPIEEPTTHKLFPLVIYENKVSCHEEIKKILLENYEKEKFPVIEKKDLPLNDGSVIKDGLTTETFTGEGHGLATLHKKPYYKKFYTELLQHAYAYMRMLGLRTDNVDLYVMKSWLVIHEDYNHTIPFHVHPESNISFVYYTQTTEFSQSILFENALNQNELSQDIFNVNLLDVQKDDKMLVEPNEYNTNVHQLHVKEGMILMFPGWRTRHGTNSVLNADHFPSNEETPVPRLAIAGDLKIVLRPDRLSTMTLCSSLDHWQKLND